MKTVVEYCHGENGKPSKIRTHYGNADELATVRKKNTGDMFYDMDNKTVYMYDEVSESWKDQTP